MRIMIIDLNNEVYFWQDDMRLVMHDWYGKGDRLYWRTPNSMTPVIDEISAVKYVDVDDLDHRVRDYLHSEIGGCNLSESTITIINLFRVIIDHKVQANE